MRFTCNNLLSLSHSLSQAPLEQTDSVAVFNSYVIIILVIYLTIFSHVNCHSYLVARSFFISMCKVFSDGASFEVQVQLRAERERNRVKEGERERERDKSTIDATHNTFVSAEWLVMRPIVDWVLSTVDNASTFFLSNAFSHSGKLFDFGVCVFD